jgi:hypothetical protein
VIIVEACAKPSRHLGQPHAAREEDAAYYQAISRERSAAKPDCRPVPAPTRGDARRRLSLAGVADLLHLAAKVTATMSIRRIMIFKMS